MTGVVSSGSTDVSASHFSIPTLLTDFESPDEAFTFECSRWLPRVNKLSDASLSVAVGTLVVVDVVVVFRLSVVVEWMKVSYSKCSQFSLVHFGKKMVVKRLRVRRMDESPVFVSITLFSDTSLTAKQ